MKAKRRAVDDQSGTDFEPGVAQNWAQFLVNKAVPAFYGDAFHHCSPQTITLIWAFADFAWIGGGPALGRVGFSIAATSG
jgi:hypothetical protein